MAYLSISITVMKKNIVIIILFFTCCAASAQTTGQHGTDIPIRICNPSRSQMISQPPLWVIISQNKIIYKGNEAVKELNPNDIEAINVLKDSTAIIKYGKAALYGVIEVHLKNGTTLDTGKLNTDRGKLIKNR